MRLSQDFRDLLAALERAGVDYLVVGGYAVSLHSKPRYTKDIDLWIGPDADNARRAARALESFGAPPAAVRDVQTCRPDEIVWLGKPPARIDILKQIPGVEFGAAYARRVEMKLDDARANVISRDDLIAAKMAAARPQDLLDADVLRKTR